MSNLSQFFNVIAANCNVVLNSLTLNSITICQGGTIIFQKSAEGPNNVGCYYEGGHVICKASSAIWIVSPRQSQVLRTWYLINDSNSLAQTYSGCPGWFVPSLTQLQNPGYACRIYWDSYCGNCFWSSTAASTTNGQSVNFAVSNAAVSVSKSTSQFVRSFRCLSY